MLLHLTLQLMIILGDISVFIKCGNNPHEKILDNLKTGEKIITKDPVLFYKLIKTNQIYWPAGLEGKTAGNVQYNANYDSTFKWLIDTTDPFIKNSKNPGAKFSWDSASFQYFKDNYRLFKSSNIDTCCLNGFEKSSRIKRNVYLYKRNDE